MKVIHEVAPMTPAKKAPAAVVVDRQEPLGGEGAGGYPTSAEIYSARMASANASIWGRSAAFIRLRMVT